MKGLRNWHNLCQHNYHHRRSCGTIYSVPCSPPRSPPPSPVPRSQLNKGNFHFLYVSYIVGFYLSICRLLWLNIDFQNWLLWHLFQMKTIQTVVMVVASPLTPALTSFTVLIVSFIAWPREWFLYFRFKWDRPRVSVINMRKCLYFGS